MKLREVKFAIGKEGDSNAPAITARRCPKPNNQWGGQIGPEGVLLTVRAFQGGAAYVASVEHWFTFAEWEEFASGLCLIDADEAAAGS